MELQYLGYADLNCLINAVIPNLQREAGGGGSVGLLPAIWHAASPGLGAASNIFSPPRRLFAQQHSFHLH
jgi:hypothetical protein